MYYNAFYPRTSSREDGDNIARFHAVLLGVENQGNIGAVARTMMNFGIGKLWLIDVPEMTDEALHRSMHAHGLLERAVRVGSLKDVECDFLVATSDTLSGKEDNFARYSLSPREFAERFAGTDAVVAIVLGREHSGLSIDEVVECDFQVTIPTSGRYPSMNVSHAAAVIFYEVYLASKYKRKKRTGMRPASKSEKDRLSEQFDHVIDHIRYQRHKAGKTKLLFRRMIARAAPSKWEYHTLMGVFKRIREKRRKGT